MQRVLEQIVDKKIDYLKGVNEKWIEEEMDKLLSARKLLIPMKQYRKLETEIKELEKKRDSILKSMQASWKLLHNYNWENALEEQAMAKIPVFQKLQGIKNDIPMTVLIAGSGKALASVYEKFTTEINSL
jgi:hypothetical protein